MGIARTVRLQGIATFRNFFDLLQDWDIQDIERDARSKKYPNARGNQFGRQQKSPDEQKTHSNEAPQTDNRLLQNVNFKPNHDNIPKNNGNNGKPWNKSYNNNKRYFQNNENNAGNCNDQIPKPLKNAPKIQSVEIIKTPSTVNAELEKQQSENE